MVATNIEGMALGSGPFRGEEPGPRRLRLELEVSDPEVLVELQRHRGAEREDFALQALRIGVLSLRMAGGHIDATAIRASGDKLVADVRELLAGAATRMT